MKNFWAVILLIALLIGSGLYFSSHKQVIAPVEQVATTTPAGTVTASTTSQRIDDKENNFTANVETPTIFGHANAQAFNDIAKVYVDRATEAFAQSAAEANFNIPETFKNQSHSFTAKASSRVIADRYVSVIFTREYDMLAAAHPFHLTETLVYDLDAKKVIELSDIFENTDKALDYLASRSAEQVRSNLAAMDAEESFIGNGTAPEEANYRSFSIDASGLTFYFAEYQVAPYAAGPQKVVLTWIELRPLLSAQFKALAH